MRYQIYNIVKQSQGLTELYISAYLNGLISIHDLRIFSYMDNVQRNLLWNSIFATALYQ